MTEPTNTTPATQPNPEDARELAEARGLMDEAQPLLTAGQTTAADEAARAASEALLAEISAEQDRREQAAIAYEACFGEQEARGGRARRERLREQVSANGETGPVTLHRVMLIARCRAALAYVETGPAIRLFDSLATKAFGALIEHAEWNPRAEGDARDLIRAATNVIRERKGEIAADALKERGFERDANDWTRAVLDWTARRMVKTESIGTYVGGDVEEAQQARFTAQTPRREAAETALTAKWFAPAEPESQASH
jgi:hypothetical protein